MALSDNPYIDMPLGTVQELQALYIQVQKDIAKGGISYSFPGRSFTRANLTEVTKTLSLLGIAIRYISGRGLTRAQATIDSQSRFSN